MAISVLQSSKKLFGHRNMQILLEVMSTYNQASQAIAVDANAYDIQSTGTAWALINGQPEQIEADAALDISADTTEAAKTAWAAATAYVAGDIRWSDDGYRVRCILAHTSTLADKPRIGENYPVYWEYAPHTAVNANGTVVADTYERWFMVTAQADGTLNIWEAGDSVLTSASLTPLKVPQVDLKKYVPVAFVLYANSAADAADDIIGAAATCDFGTYGTFVQIIGSVFPHESNWDSN